jgi:hypothetical protein
LYFVSDYASTVTKVVGVFDVFVRRFIQNLEGASDGTVYVWIPSSFQVIYKQSGF